MDKEILNTITEVAQKAAETAVAKMREFHLDDLKVLGERMDIGFESVNRRIDGVDVRLDGIDSRLDGIDSRLDGIDSRLDGIDDRLDKIEVRLDRVENALATLLQEFKDHSDKVHTLEKQVSELTMRVKLLEDQLTTS